MGGLHFSEEEGEGEDGTGRGEVEGGVGGGNCDQAGEKLRHLLSEAIPIWKCYCKAHASRGFGWKGLRASHLQL